MNLITKIVIFFATGGGAGFLPLAPGTWGSVIGFGVAWWLHPLSPLVYGLTLVTFIFCSVWISAAAQEYFERADPSQVVIDEIVACLVCMWGISWTWPHILLAFALFRLLDARKPWPIHLFERLPGGWGIVADDLVAAAMTWGVMWSVQAL